MKKFAGVFVVSTVLAGVIYFQMTGNFQQGNYGNRPSVKRVIGMPGDRVEVRQKAVYINGIRQSN